MEKDCLQILPQLQAMLESIYEVKLEYDVRQFTCTDRKFASAISNFPNSTPEQLLINENDDCLDISLFLDSSVLENLQHNNPFNCLHDRNLQSFWIAVEGVSHFLYVAWRAGFNRPVSQLELELQAEIDKFICAAYLFRQQQPSFNLNEIWIKLFKHYYLHDHLSADQVRRYQQANEYAGQYCIRLKDLVTSRKYDNPYYKQLRRFYRLGQNGKIAHITAMHYAPAI